MGASAADRAPGAGDRSARSPWSYTVTGVPRFAGRSVMSGSIRDHVPPAGPQPMRGMWTEAPRALVWPARRSRAVSVAS